jgi:hypothetical protein
VLSKLLVSYNFFLIFPNLFINYFKLNKSFAATAAAFYDLDTDSITVNEPENIKLDEKFFYKLIQMFFSYR